MKNKIPNKKESVDSDILIRFVKETKEGKFGFIIVGKKEQNINKRIQAQRLVVTNPEEEYSYSVS